MEKKYTWHAKKHIARKDASWFWAVGILSVGGAAAGIIAGNILLAILILVGGFAVMVAGSRPGTNHSYAVSDTGIHIDSQIVPWDKIERFRIKRAAESVLIIQTLTLLGTTEIPLTGVAVADVEMELKNRNLEEDDEMESIVESIMRGIGI